jgi:hypothetical protein
MKSYPCETTSRQPPLSYQPEDFYGEQLFWYVPQALSDHSKESRPHHWQNTESTT